MREFDVSLKMLLVLLFVLIAGESFTVMLFQTPNCFLVFQNVLLLNWQHVDAIFYRTSTVGQLEFLTLSAVFLNHKRIAGVNIELLACTASDENPVIRNFFCRANGCCDQHEWCRFWQVFWVTEMIELFRATMGECRTNQHWMSLNCQLACNSCNRRKLNRFKTGVKHLQLSLST